MAVVGFRRRTELRWGAGAARGGAAHHALAAGAAQLDRVAACGRAQADGRRLDQRAQRHARGREQRVVARGAQLQPQRARRQVRQQRGVHSHHVLHGCVERGPAPAAASRLPRLPHAPPGAAAAPASRCSAPHDRRAGRSASADRGDVRCGGAPRAVAGRRAQRVVLEEVERHVRATAFARRAGRAAGQLGARDVHLEDVLVVRQVLAAVLPARRRLGRPLTQARPACCGRALCCMGPGMARAVCRLYVRACPVIGSFPLGHGAPDAPRAAARPAQRLSRRRRARAGCRGATRAGCATRAAARPARRAPPPAAPCAARGARRVMAMPAAAPPAARRRPMRLRSGNPGHRAARPRAPPARRSRAARAGGRGRGPRRGWRRARRAAPRLPARAIARPPARRRRSPAPPSALCTCAAAGGCRRAAPPAGAGKHGKQRHKQGARAARVRAAPAQREPRAGRLQARAQPRGLARLGRAARLGRRQARAHGLRAAGAVAACRRCAPAAATAVLAAVRRRAAAHWALRREPGACADIGASAGGRGPGDWGQGTLSSRAGAGRHLHLGQRGRRRRKRLRPQRAGLALQPHALTALRCARPASVSGRVARALDTARERRAPLRCRSQGADLCTLAGWSQFPGHLQGSQHNLCGAAGAGHGCVPSKLWPRRRARLPAAHAGAPAPRARPRAPPRHPRSGRRSRRLCLRPRPRRAARAQQPAGGML